MKRARVLASLKEMSPEFDSGGIDLAVLFGSLNENRPSSWSDVDIGLLAPHRIDRIDWTVRFMRHLGLNEIDVVDLRTASSSLAWKALSDGELVFARSPSVVVRAKTLAWARYHDTEKLRVAQERSLRRFLESRGALL